MDRDPNPDPDPDRDLDEAVSVSEGDVTVEKSFVRDDFPVPAVKLTIASTANEPNHVRLVDRIPESFPMERVGFHPEYDSDHWTAYKDHRVVYERMFSPGESMTTVYGVRIDDDEDPNEFLRRPLLQQRPSSSDAEFESIDGILGRDDGVVRDLLVGERSASAEVDAPDSSLDTEMADADVVVADEQSDAAAIEGPPEATADDGERGDAITASAAEPPDLGDANADEVAVAIDDAVADETVDEADDQADGDADRTPSAESDEQAAAAADAAGETDGDLGPEVSMDTDAGTKSIVAALAAELRAGGVAEDDLAVLRRELDGGVPRSVDVRIRRLQGQVNDVAAYSDALAEFLDENGTGTEVIEGLRDEIESMSTELADMSAALSDAEADRAALRDDVVEVGRDVDAVERRLDEQDGRFESIETDATEAIERAAAAGDTAETVAERVGEVESAADAHDERLVDLGEELGEVYDDIASLDGDLLAARESVEADVDDLREDLGALDAKVDRVESFRDRLSGVFGATDAEMDAE